MIQQEVFGCPEVRLEVLENVANIGASIIRIGFGGYIIYTIHIRGFPKIGDPNIVPSMIGSLL